jgi:Bax protein
MTPVRSLFARGTRARAIVGAGLCAALLSVAMATGPHVIPVERLDGHRDSTIVALFSGPLPQPPSDVGVKALEERLTDRGYTLAAVRDDGAAVPRLFLARLPADLPTLDSPESRKEVFVKMLLPLVLAENERILADRERLARLHGSIAAGGILSIAESNWLEALADRYELEYDPEDVDDLIDELLLRVDAVPPSLAIGQAALETGWGTSPAARGQAMFGQMVFYNDGERAEVRRFERLAHAVQAYEINLNTHKAYAGFRKERAKLRNRGAVASGYELALTLARYSERKMNYVRDVRGIIRANKLQPLDAARLDGRPQLAGG